LSWNGNKFRDCAGVGSASKNATAASRDKPNNKGRRENAGRFASPFMPGLPSRAAIQLLRQIHPKSLKQYPMPPLALQYLLTRSAGTRGFGCTQSN
jgi:hypothetical protein